MAKSNVPAPDDLPPPTDLAELFGEKKTTKNPFVPVGNYSYFYFDSHSFRVSKFFLYPSVIA